MPLSARVETPVRVGYTAERVSPFAIQSDPVTSVPEPAPVMNFGNLDIQPSVPSAPAPNASAYELVSSSSAYDLNISQPVAVDRLTDLVIDEPVSTPEYYSSGSDPGIEIVSVNDPEYQTVFSDTAADLPLDKHMDYIPDEYVAPGDLPLIPIDTPSTYAAAATDLAHVGGGEHERLEAELPHRGHIRNVRVTVLSGHGQRK